MDLHVQVWTSNAEVPSSTWTLDNTFAITIDDVTGLITVTRTIGSIDLLIRVVILG